MEVGYRKKKVITSEIPVPQGVVVTPELPEGMYYQIDSFQTYHQGSAFYSSGTVFDQLPNYPESKFIYAEIDPPYPDQGSVFYAHGSPVTQTVSYPKLKEIVSAQIESPRPDSGVAISSVSRSIIPEITTESVISSTEAPPSYAGYSFYYVGPGIATPAPTFLTPIYVAAQREIPSPDRGYVITLVNQINLPVRLIYPTISVSESQRSEDGKFISLNPRLSPLQVTPAAKLYASAESPKPESGYVIILNTIVAQVQNITAKPITAYAESPRPDPGYTIISPSFISLSQTAQTPTAQSQYIRQEFVQSAIGGDGAALFTPSMTLSTPGGGGDGGDRLKYKRLRPHAKARLEKEAKIKIKHKEAESFIKLLISSGVLDDHHL